MKWISKGRDRRHCKSVESNNDEPPPPAPIKRSPCSQYTASFLRWSQTPAKRKEGGVLTANQNRRCHGGHRVWRVAQVQHVSRHLVQAVHCIFKHEGHHHIGHLSQKMKQKKVWEKSETQSELRKHHDNSEALEAGCFVYTPLDRSGNELVDASTNGIEMVIKAN